MKERMTLDQYFTRPGSLRLTDLSKAIGVTKGRLSQLRHSKDWPGSIALAVERATDGAVNASDLSPVVREARATSQTAA